MKVLPFTIPKPKRDAIILQEDVQASFYGVLHRHQELQLSYIVKGEGVLIVGDTVHSYTEEDVVVLGSNLPHVFRSKENHQETSHMISIFFTKSSFGTEFFATEELQSLVPFFKKSESGFKLNRPSQRIKELFLEIHYAKKLPRFLLFLELLHLLRIAKSTNLASFHSEKKYNDMEGARMGAVFQYTMNHFREKITLEAVSKVAAMTPNAFCNYFKKRTRKTYVTFLNEMRVEEACRLLRERNELSIAEIAEKSGFQNISNFNRKFKEIKSIRPMDFRKRKDL